MKKTYICPNMLAVKLNTTNNILIGSNFGTDSATITTSDTEVDDPNSVWVKANINIWDDEW